MVLPYALIAIHTISYDVCVSDQMYFDLVSEQFSGSNAGFSCHEMLMQPTRAQNK